MLVWQKSMDLVTSVYSMTKTFPRDEIFGLISQIRRCVVSIPSNIAEGKRRSSDSEFRRFLHYAYASGAELETQLLIAKNLVYISQIDFEKINGTLEEVMKMLNVLIQTVSDNV